MAAIKPHLAEDGETTELEEKYWRCSSQGLEGLGRGVDDELCPTPGQVVNQSHGELLTVAYTRQIIVEQLRGRTITPAHKGGQVVLSIDEPIEGPLWNPMPGSIRNTTLLSWTTKMGAPSFSLPAGASAMGGSCPGATAGQSLVPDEDRRKVAKQLLKVLKAPHVELAKSICETCYAEGGQYASASVQYHQMIRYTWTRRALTEDLEGRPVKTGSMECAFVQLMIDAIDRVDFELREEPSHWAGKRFFRIHDSGDFFSVAYIEAWKHVANHFHSDNRNTKVPITFWAPTRIWALGPEMVKEVDRINGPAKDSNLIIRPSAYHVDQYGPEHLGPGWAAPSVTYMHDNKEEALGKTYDWDCRAYESQKGPSCRGAEAPAKGSTSGSGVKGCRACWMRPELRINYTLH